MLSPGLLELVENEVGSPFSVQLLLAVYPMELLTSALSEKSGGKTDGVSFWAF